MSTAPNAIEHATIKGHYTGKQGIIEWRRTSQMDHLPVKVKMLSGQVRGLQQTASGYGAKLHTSFMALYKNRWHRIYCRCYTNSGTLYILSKGKKFIVEINTSYYKGEE